MTVIQTGAWILPGPQALPPELEAFLEAGEPPVYLGFGSMPAAESMSRTVVEAARAVGRRVVLSRGWAELGLTDSKPDCIAIGDVNHQVLFPRVAVAVHHGGAGTTAAAALAGIPQVTVPLFGDQFYWSRRVRDMGVGSSAPAGDLTAEVLARCLQDALAPSAAQRAQSLACMVCSQGAAIAALRLVEEYG
jgi:vancomycin aglycone glucosyltransferase